MCAVPCRTALPSFVAVQVQQAVYVDLLANQPLPPEIIALIAQLRAGNGGGGGGGGLGDAGAAAAAAAGVTPAASGTAAVGVSELGAAAARAPTPPPLLAAAGPGVTAGLTAGGGVTGLGRSATPQLPGLSGGAVTAVTGLSGMGLGGGGGGGGGGGVATAGNSGSVTAEGGPQFSLVFTHECRWVDGDARGNCCIRLCAFASAHFN